MSELLAVAGIDILGPLPVELQQPIVVYGVTAFPQAVQGDATRAFVDFLRADAGRGGLRRKGLDPAESAPKPLPEPFLGLGRHLVGRHRLRRRAQRHCIRHVLALKIEFKLGAHRVVNEHLVARVLDVLLLKLDIKLL